MCAKITLAGKPWLTLRRDVVEYVKKYHCCQIFTPSVKVAPEELDSILSPWPLAKWRIDITGPLPTALGKVKFTRVVVDYFTKWAEAGPYQPSTRIMSSDLYREISSVGSTYRRPSYPIMANNLMASK